MNKTKLSKFWKNKKVLITGNSGFKGSWLTILLNYLEANTYGISLRPKNKINLYTITQLESNTKTFFLDMKNIYSLGKMIKKIKPDIVFHLAAQPIVSTGFKDPKSTIHNNLLSTLNLLEIFRNYNQECTIIIVTTDKVYAAKDKQHFVESDLLESYCPYASSKIMVENLVSCYNNSFFYNESLIKISTSRSGNVIGGGDWSEDRLIPDIIKSWKLKRKLMLRMPYAIRPWMHVLDSLNGYIKQAEFMFKGGKNFSSFNFGPESNEVISVREILQKCKKNLYDLEFYENKMTNLKETKILMLNSSRAKKILGFKNKWGIDKSIFETIKWYKLFYEGKNPYDLCLDNIKDYLE